MPDRKIIFMKEKDMVSKKEKSPTKEVSITVGMVIEFVNNPGQRSLIANIRSGEWFSVVPIIEGKKSTYLQGVGSTHYLSDKFRVIGNWSLLEIKKAMENFYREALDLEEEEVIPSNMMDTVDKLMKLYTETLGQSRTVLI